MKKIDRRNFFKVAGISGAGIALTPYLKKINAKTLFPDKPKTNIGDALNYPRTTMSLPGKYPGKVVQVNDAKSITDNQFDQERIYNMVERSILELTGDKDISKAWLKFVSRNDRIGLKVNPVAGPTLSTSPEIVKAIIQQLEKARIPLKNIVIWDRREFELFDAGFTEDNFPGIKIIGTERKDKNGSFYNSEGKLYGEEMIDKQWYYWADVEEKYDAETIPYMINEGKHSYFSKILTQDLDKVINIPILKNAGPTVTLCLKNLGFGCISNTSRLHKDLWTDTCAEVCAFPPVRDKVVLNIVDGIKGCFQGGPGANPQFFTEYKTILAGTDPVAVDRIGYDIVLKKRIEEKIQKEESPRGRIFIEYAEKLGLGTADINKISLTEIEIS